MIGLRTLALLTLLIATLTAQGKAPNGMQKGGWRPQDIPEGWVVKIVGRYEVQSNAPTEIIEKIGKHMNAINEVYKRVFPATRTPGKPFTVKVFKNREEFLAYGAPPQAAGYYSKSDKELVGYDTGKTDGVLTSGGTTGTQKTNRIRDVLRDRYTLDTLAVFAHEGWHQYFHWWCTSMIPFPSWCDEGIGEYFGTARLEGAKMTIGAPNDYRLGTIRRAIEKNEYVPLKELVTYDQREYYRIANLAYAQGWSFVHFLLEHPEWKKQQYLRKYVTNFVDLHSIDKAVVQVFSKVDWTKMEADWKAWVMALPHKSEADLLEDALSEETPAGESEKKPPTEEGPEKPVGGGAEPKKTRPTEEEKKLN